MPKLTSLTIGVTLTKICEPDPKRTSIWIQNLDAVNNLWVGFDRTIAVNTGMLFRPYAFHSFNIGDGDEVDKSVFAIGSAAGVRLTVVENFGSPIKVEVTVEIPGIQDPEDQYVDPPFILPGIKQKPFRMKVF